MTAQIQANRPEVSRQFPVLGFNVRSGISPTWIEVAIATDPKLFYGPEAKAQRTHSNFYSSRVMGPLPAEKGEAVYLLPPNVLARFIGQPKLYYALAVYRQPDFHHPEVVRIPPDAMPYVRISNSFTGGSRRLMEIPNRSGGLLGNGNSYGNGSQVSLTWGGDEAPAGEVANIPAASGSHSSKQPEIIAQPQPAARSAALTYDVAYDDGYDPKLWSQQPAAIDRAMDEDDTRGIEGPIPDVAPESVQQGLGFSQTMSESPDYPQASRFVAAAPENYRRSTSPRSINRIVIHITDGGANINGPISWFQNPDAKVSAHYIVGQDGEVVQMVRHNDVAWHAGTANRDSIGIEHVANTRGLNPTEAEYCASAALVRWLADTYSIPLDRTHILGHAEADPKTSHKACPNAVWDWDYFMGMAIGASCYPRSAMAQSYSSYRNNTPNGRSRDLQAVTYPLALVRPEYHPRDWQDALRFMFEWLQRGARWQAGVSDTTIFPHSAICHLRMQFPDGYYTGTGFYIAPNRILTCAHNVIDWKTHAEAVAIEITPGKNGAGTAPFSSFTVRQGDWQYHPLYNGKKDYDLAVIVVDVPPPNGMYFDILEELNQSLPSTIIVCGYAAETVDRDKQHLDGDTIRQLGDTGETFQYNLQTEPGNSGSPVFYVWGREDEQQQMSVLETRVVGVHVSGFDDTLNQGCRLTEAKIDWIRRVERNVSAAAQAYSRPQSSSFSSNIIYDVPPIPQPNKFSCWAAAMAMLVSYRRNTSIAPETLAEEVGRSLRTSYTWDMLEAVKDRFGFRDLELPSNATLYPSPEQWFQWLNDYGPLWVTVRGTPSHAIIVRGISGDLTPAGTTMYVFNPWDTSTTFSGDPIDFSPPNNGLSYTQPFEAFSANFGLINLPLGNWRVLYLPAATVQSAGLGRMEVAQSYTTHRQSSTARSPARAQSAVVEIGSAIAGAVMTRILDNQGDVSWELDQLRGLKHIGDNPANAGNASYQDKKIVVNGPKVTMGAVVDDITAAFEVRWQYNGRSLGNIEIYNVRTNDALGAALNVRANIMDDANTYTTVPPSEVRFAAIRVHFYYRFTFTIGADYIAEVDLTLYGNGTYSQRFRWTQQG